MMKKIFGDMPMPLMLAKLKCGIESEHFTGRIKYPNGMDHAPRINITMRKPYSLNSFPEGKEPSDIAEKALTEELHELMYQINCLEFAIWCYAQWRKERRKPA